MFVILTSEARRFKTSLMQEWLYREIGSRIRARRTQFGKKQEELAAATQLSRPSIANIESGRQNLLIHQLYKIAGALEIEPAELLPRPAKSELTDQPDVLLPDDLSAAQQKQIKSLLLSDVANEPVLTSRMRK